MEEIWISSTNPYRKSPEKSEMLLSVMVFNLKPNGQNSIKKKNTVALKQ